MCSKKFIHIEANVLLEKTFHSGARPPLGSLIEGRWVQGESTFTVLDKYSATPIAEVASATRAQVAQAVAVGVDHGNVVGFA
ncbi:MAG: hypothetical protein E2602_05180, partial [Achromobacter sp.]|nr:hypothetical protein [Achromobacter sp.]